MWSADGRVEEGPGWEEVGMRGVWTMVAVAATLAGCTASRSMGLAPRPVATSDAALRDLLDYARAQETTGFLVMRGGRTMVEENWPAPADRNFAIFNYGTTSNGQLLEDVASQQKSFIALLIGIAVDKRMIDVERPVSDYLGAGWSKAKPGQEARIRVLDILTMSSGLDEQFGYVAPAGTVFLYNTPVYAITKRILSVATGMSLERLTREWLTGPLVMRDTKWRQRPAALAGVGNATGLVTTPRDIALLGRMVLARGVTARGRRIISSSSLAAIFQRSAANPAYGRLWWLNGGAFSLLPPAQRRNGPLIPAAPADLVAALGFLDRRLYVVPSLDLVVVRTGGDAPDPDFDEHLWQRIMRTRFSR